VTAAGLVVAFAVGFALWGFAEYVLHRFVMHHLHGRGIMSREHLEHHVHASWHFDPIMVASWSGMLVVGFVGWFPLGWALVSATVGLTVAVGWTAGYAVYEYQHASSHLRAPRGRYTSWLRRHHFHHHFGHPMGNHGVSSPLWDVVFGTREVPDRVRVPRRLVLPWLVDAHGEVRTEFVDDYVLVGSASSDDRLAALDRARAFASVAPTD
jgi:sterol desaturase/sphingolipid hydroxylase (fatty acid hydroxylase superfamily)